MPGRSLTENSFRAAKHRCGNPNASDYKYYGGRGIEFRFGSLGELVAGIGERPGKEYTLDRIENSGHYETGNVQWLTRKGQMNKTRRNRQITALGETHTPAEWGSITGVSEKDITRRIDRGYCAECSVTLAPHKTCQHGYDTSKSRKAAIYKKATTVMLTAFGKTLTKSEWSRETGIGYSCLNERLRRGWSVERAVSAPPR